METVYIETSIVSYLVAHPSRDLVLRRLEREAQYAGRLLPKVCTPLELMGDSLYEDESAS